MLEDASIKNKILVFLIDGCEIQTKGFKKMNPNNTIKKYFILLSIYCLIITHGFW